MSIGFDVAGLVLSVLPLLSELVLWYNLRIGGRESRLLTESLKTNNQIFLNSIEILLRHVVAADQVQFLLANPTGEQWTEGFLNDEVKDLLGSDADNILEKMNDIYKTLSDLNRKLPSLQQAKEDKNMIKRGKKIIMCFVQGPYYRASLARLKNSIGELRALMDDNIKLAPARGMQPKALRHLKTVREFASGLHDAIQHGWQCDCEHFHPANIKLEAWSSLAENGTEQRMEDISLQFSFLFAEDAERAHSDHWITAEIAPSRSSSNESLSAATASLGDVSRRSITVQSGSSNTSPPISLSRSYSIPAGVEDNLDQNTIADVIHDLCHTLKAAEGNPSPLPTRKRQRVGSISDADNKYTYHLHTESCEGSKVPTKRSVKLAELFDQPNELRPKTRVKLALMLAWGVLQISTTSWLSGSWSRENILLVGDAPGERRPYVTHRFPSERRGSRDSRRDSHSTLDPPEPPNDLTFWIKDASHASLFALAVFLLEMCYSCSIEDMADDSEKDAEGRPYPHTPFLTAYRKARNVQETMGFAYAQAVNACLNPPDVEMDADEKRKDSQLSKSIYNNIIKPLKACAETFEPRAISNDAH